MACLLRGALHKIKTILWRLKGLYPALFAAFAVLSLYQNNIEDIQLQEVVRPLLVSTVGAGLLTMVLRRLPRQAARGGLLAAGAVLAFFSYGHVYTWLQEWQVLGRTWGHHRYALLLTAAPLAAWAAWVGWRLQQPERLEAIVRRIAVVAVLLPALSLGWWMVNTLAWRLDQSPRQAGPSADLSLGTVVERPDIYYIVLDGYGRGDILQRFYAVDNGPFLGWLEERGFFIAARSNSNYNQTVHSLSASLNMAYLDELAQIARGTPTGRAKLTDHFKHSRVRNLLESQGYSFVAFETGYSQTEIRDADFFWGPAPQAEDYPVLGSHLNRLEGLLIGTTGLRAVLDLDALRRLVASLQPNQPHYQAHRLRVEYTLGSMGQAAEIPGPTFVFAHVIAPHPPFVFGPNGESVPNEGAYSLADADAFGGSPEEYVRGYRDQLRYVNSLVKQAIADILARSDMPPVIVLQADHGPGAYMAWDSAEASLVEERMGILNAYYFPNAEYAGLYDAISPVNTFRVILKGAFGADLALLPDRSYFATWDEPFVFYEVTSRVR